MSISTGAIWLVIALVIGLMAGYFIGTHRGQKKRRAADANRNQLAHALRHCAYVTDAETVSMVSDKRSDFHFTTVDYGAVLEFNPETCEGRLHTDAGLLIADMTHLMSPTNLDQWLRSQAGLQQYELPQDTDTRERDHQPMLDHDDYQPTKRRALWGHHEQSAPVTVDLPAHDAYDPQHDPFAHESTTGTEQDSSTQALPVRS
jgi:hypothetical protein